jgi:hypothetical protein
MQRRGRNLCVAQAVGLACKSRRLDIAVRRFLVISAFWLGLFGVAEPLLACASASECCPNGTQAPCDFSSNRGTANTDSNLCCASPPLGQALTFSIKKGEAKPQPESAGTAAIALFAPSADASFAAFTCNGSRIADPAQSLGARIYRRTGRLRL